MIKLQSVNKSFKQGNNEISVLKDVSLSFPNSGLFVILGPSGSGKTTLLSLIGGLDKPDSGQIIIDDIDVTKLNEKELNNYRQNKISFVFQDHNLIDYLSLEDNALLKSHDDQDLMPLLEKLNIASLKDKKPETLSGGEKQRCAIARALLSHAPILLCDEPTASLDHENAKNILEILKEVGKTKLVIAVSHDEKLCKEYTDNIITFDNDKVVQEKAFEDAVNKTETKQEKVYRSKVFHKAFHHAKHSFKESALVIFLSLIAFFCVGMIVGLANGARSMVDNAINELIHYSPLTVSSYYSEISSVYLIKNENKDYKVGINIDQKTDIVSSLHKNIITDEFVNYLTKDPLKDTYFSFNNDQAYSFIYQEGDSYRLYDAQNVDSLNDYVETFFGKRSPVNELIYDKDYFMSKYQWLEGAFPENDNEAILVYLEHHSITEDAAKLLNLKEGDDPKTAIGKKIHIAHHDALYQVNEASNVTGHFLKDYATLQKEGKDLRSLNNSLITYANAYYEGDVETQNASKEAIYSLFKEENETRELKSFSKIQNSSSLKSLIDNNQTDEITITGIATIPENTYFAEKNNGILISNNKLKSIRENNSKSPVAQEIDNHIVLEDSSSSSLNVPKLYGYINNLTEHSYDGIQSYLMSYVDFFENRKFFSTNNEISAIEVYAPDVKTKDYYIEKINQYNANKNQSMAIKHLDLSSKVVEYLNHYIGILEGALYAISVITLVVSGMLSVAVMYNMSISRMKEIGVLRACGYSRGYIFSLLEIESVSFGLISGALGVLFANIVAPLIRRYFYLNSGDFILYNIIQMTPFWNILIIIIALVASFLAGLLPAIICSKKKPIDIIKS